ncbi:Canalicular multispecific organic anion transporter 2 [Tyrophagus putrescentiae]|nr:Canalicular multispecific organic anion transporter 2 [Tyrophagus putrescentiae]
MSSRLGEGGGKGASFSWQKNAKPVLSDINLKVRRGALVAIVGHVGAGKSSLLSAILGDMEPVGTSCTVNIAAGESVAYVGQCAWIANGSLRSNILLGSSSSSEPLRYRSALEQCALLPDLATLPAGELTEIGEKGINLSGGQRARVALARAVHSAASLLLLDDPLSAVDSHVARHIFRRVLSSRTGVLRGRTRLLVTHSLALLPEVDQIVVMEGGRVAEAGTYQQLMADRQGRFAAFVREHSTAATSTLNCPAPEQQLLSPPPPPPSPSPPKKVVLRDELSRSSLSSSSSSSFSSGGNHRLITPEKAKSGRVSVSVYATYLRSLTAPWLLMTALGYVGMQAASVGHQRLAGRLGQ